MGPPGATRCYLRTALLPPLFLVYPSRLMKQCRPPPLGVYTSLPPLQLLPRHREKVPPPLLGVCISLLPLQLLSRVT